MALRFKKYIYMGCDPEFFFTKNDKIIGAEKILKSELLYERGEDTLHRDGERFCKGKFSKIIVDGVQAELNPRPSTCRAMLANEIVCIMRKLVKQHKDIKINCESLVKLDKEELKSLSEKAKIFGCDPDYNVYKRSKNVIKINPKRTLKRTAGGHIHLGLPSNANITVGGKLIRDIVDKINIHDLKDGEFYCNKELEVEGIVKLDACAKALQDIKRIIPLLDIVVGNTSVLLDRKGKHRRKIYGKAGDYRLQPHGIEYRTLSNFWLKNYILLSLIFGLARQAYLMLADEIRGDTEYASKIFSAVDIERVVYAINENDFKTALENFKIIEPILIEASGFDTSFYPLNELTIDVFYYLVKKGIDNVFKEDMIQHWVNLPEAHEIGWESWAKNFDRREVRKWIRKRL